jgi:hypothetical protein
MKNIIITLLILCSATFGLIYAQPAKAFCVNSASKSNCSSGNNGDICSGAGSSSSYCQDTASGQNPITGTNGYILKAARFISYAAGVAAVIVIIIGAIRFIISSGDAKSVNEARNMIIYALVGLVVIIVANLIVSLAAGTI